MLGAGTFWLLIVAARWSLRWAASAPPSGQKFSLPTLDFEIKYKYPHCHISMRVFAGLDWLFFYRLLAINILELFGWQILESSIPFNFKCS